MARTAISCSPVNGQFHLLELLALSEIASLNRAGRQKWNSHRTCLKTEPNGKVGVLLDLDRMWDTGFGGASIIMAEAGGDISHP
jgi:hypothetical protein